MRLSLSRLVHAVLGLAVAIVLLTGPVAWASAGDIALTLVRGPNADKTLEFTLDELEALPQTTIVTENEFTDGAVTFRGPLVRDILEHLGMEEAETIRFVAANDYYVDIPAGDFRKYNVILALEADGSRLSRRERGPLWLMYPISDHSELRSPVYNTRLIWQVVRVESL